jgi:hypothetical protein
VIYLKSALAGVLVFVLALVFYMIGGLIYAVATMPSPPPNTEIAIDLRSVSPPLWQASIFALVAFVAAFYWTFRRSSRTT